MYVVCIEANARISGCRSLKDKRSIVSRTMADIRKTFHASVAETAMQDNLDRLCIGVAVACSSMGIAQSIIQAIEDWFYSHPELINPDVETGIA